MSSNGESRNSQTPSSPCGVTVWEMSATVRSSAWWIRTPAARAASMISVCRSAASTVANSSMSVGTPPVRWAMASRTACGPSAMNRRSLPRKARRASRRAAVTRGERGEISSGVPMGGGSLLWFGAERRGKAADPQAGACGSASLCLRLKFRQPSGR